MKAFLYSMYEIPKGNMHGYASNQSKCKKKNVAESFTRFSNMTGICKIPWSLICVSTFPPKNHKSRILPPEHAKSATYCDKEDLNFRLMQLHKVYYKRIIKGNKYSVPKSQSCLPKICSS